MKKRTPPPSLGKLHPRKIVKGDKFAEWQLMKQEVDGWRDLISPVLRLQGFTRIRVFAVGSPRHFQVVTKASSDGEWVFKRMKRDIRTASHHFWMEQFIAANWENRNHVIDGTDCE